VFCVFSLYMISMALVAVVIVHSAIAWLFALKVAAVLAEDTMREIVKNVVHENGRRVLPLRVLTVHGARSEADASAVLRLGQRLRFRLPVVLELRNVQVLPVSGHRARPRLHCSKGRAWSLHAESGTGDALQCGARARRDGPSRRQHLVRHAAEQDQQDEHYQHVRR
jgi:hypothetical protein